MTNVFKQNGKISFVIQRETTRENPCQTLLSFHFQSTIITIMSQILKGMKMGETTEMLTFLLCESGKVQQCITFRSLHTCFFASLCEFQLLHCQVLKHFMVASKIKLLEFLCHRSPAIIDVEST